MAKRRKANRKVTKRRSFSLRNISRVETLSSAGNFNCGWQVRLQRRGQRFDRYFADSLYNGKRAALSAAKAYRDYLLKVTRSFTVKELAQYPSIRNNSGVVGVRSATQVEYRGGYEFTYHFWVAQWTDADGRRRTRSFSCDKYGEDEAFRLAVQARDRGVAGSQAAQ
ncbi:MAG TPA: AP2/ERF family transcription factor [Pirellulaceae bacterium]|nr:AP2/ERF family transcription factor [Pirellulaceae bacterium]HMO92173.1 AP2/ERF family transcription factor [Pirellulaceae bacterium]HMP68900.1 AP2/ERF family transcription factor [Pirellulaceae bacterium]